jgi:hypothetical protein
MTSIEPGADIAPSGAGDDATQSPKELLGAAAGAVKQEVAAFASSMQDKASEQVAEHKDAATATLDAFANAVRHAGDELAQQDQSLAGRVVKQAADGLEHLSRSVSERRPEEMLGAVRDFGRRNPTAFIAGSVLLGVALGRFARSSESHGDTSTYVPSQDFGQSVATLKAGNDGRAARSVAGAEPTAAATGVPPAGESS